MIKAAWERLRQSMALYLRFAELLREHRFAMGLVLSLVLATVALVMQLEICKFRTIFNKLQNIK